MTAQTVTSLPLIAASTNCSTAKAHLRRAVRSTTAYLAQSSRSFVSPSCVLSGFHSLYLSVYSLTISRTFPRLYQFVSLSLSLCAFCVATGRSNFRPAHRTTVMTRARCRVGQKANLMKSHVPSPCPVCPGSGCACQEEGREAMRGR